MVSVGLIRQARALGLALGAAALTACASMPAPVTHMSRESSALPQPQWGGLDGPRVVNPSARLQCVPYARQESGIEIYGDAVTWWNQAAGRYPRSNTPASGSVLVVQGYRNPGRGHVAVVREIVSGRIILVDHANWLNRGEISVRVPVLDVSEANDWSAVRVWYIPGAHWGGRVYAADGFIHPFTLRGLLS